MTKAYGGRGYSAAEKEMNMLRKVLFIFVLIAAVLPSAYAPAFIPDTEMAIVQYENLTDNYYLRITVDGKNAVTTTSGYEIRPGQSFSRFLSPDTPHHLYIVVLTKLPFSEYWQVGTIERHIPPTPKGEVISVKIYESNVVHASIMRQAYLNRDLIGSVLMFGLLFVVILSGVILAFLGLRNTIE
ncbi:MAG: hypothetical protein Q7S28_04360 [bacterium]|nr:hypothetical protein [bacterium]